MIWTSAAISLTSPAMLLAAAAVALPIAAHLLSRRARRRVTFPSIKLLAEAAAGQSRLFRLRRLLLLALRCLAILLIATAFARPVWVDTPAAGEESHDQQALVVVVDVSASAAQRTDGVSTFARLQAAAAGVLDEVRPGRDVANLVIADAQPHAAFPQPIPNPQALLADVRDLQPTADRADLSAAIALAERMLLEQDAQRRLVVVSDMQATNWEDVPPTALSPGTADRPIDMVIVPAGNPASEPANVALQGPRANPPFSIGDRGVELSVEAINYSPSPRDATVALHVDGRMQARASVTLEPWQSRRITFDAVTLENATPPDSGTFAGARVSFRIQSDDALAVDDHAYLVVPASGQRNVALVTDADPADTAAEPFYLLRALSPHGDARDDLNVSVWRSDDLATADLANDAVVVISDTAHLDDATVQALTAFVEQGGGVIVTSTGTAAAERLASLGDLTPWEAASRLTLEDAEARRFGDGAWGGDVLGVFDTQGRDALERASFRQIMAVADAAERAEVLLRFDEGEPALGRVHVGQGRVVVANFGVAPAESDLASRGVFVPLVHVMLDAARAGHDVSPPLLVGQRPPLPADEDDGPSVAEVRTPEGNALEGRTRQPGFHTLLDEAGEVVDVVAVNVDPRESDLRRVAIDDLEQRRAEADANAGQRRAIRAAAHDADALHLTGQPLWHYFLMAALAMLAVELGLMAWWRR